MGSNKREELVFIYKPQLKSVRNFFIVICTLAVASLLSDNPNLCSYDTEIPECVFESNNILEFKELLYYLLVLYILAIFLIQLTKYLKIKSPIKNHRVILNDSSIIAPSPRWLKSVETKIKYNDIIDLRVSKYQDKYTLKVISKNTTITIESSELKQKEFELIFNELRQILSNSSLNIVDFDQLPCNIAERERKELYPLHIILFIYLCISASLFFVFVEYYFYQIDVTFLQFPALVTGILLLTLTIKTMKKYKRHKCRVQVFALRALLGMVFIFGHCGHLGFFSAINQIGDNSDPEYKRTTIKKIEHQSQESIKSNGLCYRLVDFTDKHSVFFTDLICEKDFKRLKEGMKATVTYKSGNFNSKWITGFELNNNSKMSQKKLQAL